ncbi:YkvA family protein [Clostridium cylindrosporum]|uniref:DUF1232 domain-containing protein n=1 Tax=Clostridium cylindrosporum DSM 605 TaxID=1121307 RepID=A0A0J8G6L8_CLOCY|nr:DUF1232 domain-containing protein [Clostridium cylindrosporum]KMT23251.1 hypothetical protein CLCY_6c01320 [Clostridium cylindrosporum DSM 605]
MVDNQYNKDYSEDSLFKKIKSVLSKAKVSVVYGALLLFYSLKDPDVPKKAKTTIIGALGYFIVPTDLMADIVPVVGFGDDLTAIISALSIIAIYISPETKNRAKEKTKELFNNALEDDFKEIDDKI